MTQFFPRIVAIASWVTYMVVCVGAALGGCQDQDPSLYPTFFPAWLRND